VKRALIAPLLLATLSIFAADQSDPRFEKWMEISRKIFASHHLIANVRLAHIDREGAPLEARYDRYPNKAERVQWSDGATFARKKDKAWLESQDWGESGKPVEAEEVMLAEMVISYADLPLKSKGQSRDKSQGATVVRVIDQRTTKEGNEEIVFEQGREHPKEQLNYPKYTFFRFKGAAPEDVQLSNFSGPVYDADGNKVQLDVRYEYTVAVKMDDVKIVTPPPSATHP
jgi:hypothetical protein